MATILITGGLGYIGSHTALALQQVGYTVLILDNLANAELETLNRIKRITGKKPSFAKIDMQDYKGLSLYLKQHPEIEAVIHFAAHKSVGESVANPLAYYQNNLGSLLNLLRAMEENGLKNLVFSSSCSVYGEVHSLPVVEQTPTQAMSPYGNTKKVSEEILQDVAKARHGSFPIIALRYFNPVGAHESGFLGETSKTPANNLVPVLMQKALGIRAELHVFGHDYDTIDGTCVRDYIHVEDLAQAHIAATQRLLENKQTQNYEVFNVGAGKGYSVMQVIESFERVSGIKLSYTLSPRREGDVSAVYADVQLVEKELNWKATKTLDEMTLSAWHWEQYYQSKQVVNNE